MKSMRSSTMSAPPSTASLISERASSTVGAITLVVSAHDSPPNCDWGRAPAATVEARIGRCWRAAATRFLAALPS